jgi:spermidine/putrescine transport system permease protein
MTHTPAAARLPNDDRPPANRRPLDARRHALAMATFGIVMFMYLPIVTLMIFSFNEGKVMHLPLSGWTLDWYARAFGNPQLMEALVNSLIVAAAAVVLCLLIGIPAALLLNSYDFPGKNLFRRVAILPMTLPGLITGVSMLSFFAQVGVPLSLLTVIVGHGTALSAVVVLNVYARLQRFDRRIIEASGDLGAGPLRTFWHVTLPNIRTAIIGSSLLAFTLSFDEIAVTFFLTGRDNTLPMYIWSAIRRGITPEINAIGTVIIVVSIALILASILLTTESGGRRRAQPAGAAA